MSGTLIDPILRWMTEMIEVIEYNEPYQAVG